MSKHKIKEIRRSVSNAKLAITDTVSYYLTELENLEKSERNPYTKVINPVSLNERMDGLRELRSTLSEMYSVVDMEIDDLAAGVYK